MKSTIEPFDACTRDRCVDAQSVPGEARLAPSVLVTNEMGVSALVPEELSATNWAKVVLRVPSSAVSGAQLLFYVNRDGRTKDRPMKLWINGHPLEHRQDAELMLTGGWDRINIPTEYLQNGPNTVVFGDHGLLHVDPKLDGRSQRSFDGGTTWHTGALGPRRDQAGEYMVRLRLRGHPPTGVLSSPVIDLADPDGRGRIAPAADVWPISVTAEQDTPAGTGIVWALRTGTTPGFDPLHWAPWKEATGLSDGGRFVQWRATLRTDSADVTPVLRSVTISADTAIESSCPDEAKLVALERPAIETSSYPFTYMVPNAKLTRLRKQWRLEDVVAAGNTELEQLALLRDWVHSQWLGWQQDTYPYCPPWDPIEILETTKGNWGFGMCTHYAATFVGCATALGYAARSVIIDHHCVAEVWSDQLQKWIIQDAGPSREFDVTYERDGVPLNALEVHEALRLEQGKKLTVRKLPHKKVEPAETHLASFVRFGIALRNDHLANPGPAELEHGRAEYHWDGYLWWTDDPDPKYPEYSQQSSRPEDFYPTMNRTRIFLQSGDTAGTLQVDLETQTPAFDHFLRQVDGGNWQAEGARFSWDLHTGENRLSVRSLSRFGREGVASDVTVQFR